MKQAARFRAFRETSLALAVATALAGCASSGSRPPSPVSRVEPASARPPAPATAGRGGYYLDDGPGSNAPPNLEAIPDAVPRAEPLLARANRPYTIFERQYEPMTRLAPYRERGPGSWYGRKYHGQRTSSGEVYDMYAMTAAHPTLPLPSYARVTNLSNGRSVVVRVNDRGPFLYGRIIDLSYTAAARLGYLNAGSAPVEVELITQFDAPAPDPSQIAARTGSQTLVGASAEPIERLQMETVITGSAAPAATPAAVPAPLPAVPTAVPAAALPSAVPAAVSAAGQSPGAAAGGHYLQLGAFSTMDGAQASRAHLARQLEWMADRIDVRADGGLFKIQAGPFTQRDEALAAAERIRSTTGFRPFAVTR